MTYRSFLSLLCSGLFIIFSFTSAAQGTRLLRQPTISENQIAFVYANDLWTVDLIGEEQIWEMPGVLLQMTVLKLHLIFPPMETELLLRDNMTVIRVFILFLRKGDSHKGVRGIPEMMRQPAGHPMVKLCCFPPEGKVILRQCQNCILFL